MVKYKIKIQKKGTRRDDVTLGKNDRICRKVIEYGILGLIIFSPLPAASVYEWSVLVIQLTILVMMAAYLLMRERPETSEFFPSAFKWPKMLFIGLFIFILIQILPLPNFIVKIFSPSIYSFQENFHPEPQDTEACPLALPCP